MTVAVGMISGSCRVGGFVVRGISADVGLDTWVEPQVLFLYEIGDVVVLELAEVGRENPIMLLLWYYYG